MFPVCLIHFLPCVHVAEAHPYIVLCFHHSIHVFILRCYCSSFACCFLSDWRHCLLYSILLHMHLVCEWASSPRVLHHLLPFPSLTYGCEGGTEQRHQNVHLHVYGREEVPLCNFLHQAESHICLEVGMRWGSVYSDCMSSSKLLVWFQTNLKGNKKEMVRVESSSLSQLFWVSLLFP